MVIVLRRQSGMMCVRRSIYRDLKKDGAGGEGELLKKDIFPVGMFLCKG